MASARRPRARHRSARRAPRSRPHQAAGDRRDARPRIDGPPTAPSGGRTPGGDAEQPGPVRSPARVEPGEAIDGPDERLGGEIGDRLRIAAPSREVAHEDVDVAQVHLLGFLKAASSAAAPAPRPVALASSSPVLSPQRTYLWLRFPPPAVTSPVRGRDESAHGVRSMRLQAVLAPPTRAQQSNTDQQMSFRNRWSSRTSSRIASGSWSRCHWHSSRPAPSPSPSGAPARAALIA